MSNKKAGISRAIQQERRRLLIDATMSAISEHGLSKLTLAKIAGVAGLSAGSVNFHFSSKEALLLATLTYLAEEFEQRIDQALHTAEPHPAQRLTALFEASLDPDITEPRKMAVWYAFASEARARDDYQRICGAQDKKIFDITLQLCDELIRLGGKQDYMNARAMANSVQGLIDEIWQEILYAGDDYDREDARFISLSFLASVFPWAFSTPPGPIEPRSRLTIKDKTLSIVRAEKEHLPAVSGLFDLYRQFYECEPDIDLATRFISERITNDESRIFVAMDGSEAVGFVQLYPSFCSVEAIKIQILYDLYVDASARGSGLGRKLMNHASEFAKKSGAKRIDLLTGHSNKIGQHLYEALGYEIVDEDFYAYSLYV